MWILLRLMAVMLAGVAISKLLAPSNSLPGDLLRAWSDTVTTAINIAMILVVLTGIVIALAVAQDKGFIRFPLLRRIASGLRTYGRYVVPPPVDPYTEMAALAALAEMGYPMGDKHTDPISRESIRRYQAKAGLPVTGRLDPATASRLRPVGPDRGGEGGEIETSQQSGG